MPIFRHQSYNAAMKTSIELSSACRLINHGPTVLVTSAYGSQSNVMAAAWNMPLDFNPPKLAVVVDKKTYTRELVDVTGVFALNIPCRAQANMVAQVGSCTGRNLLAFEDETKFEHFGIATFDASQVAVPLIEGCVGWLECKVIAEPSVQKAHDLLIAEVVAAWADDRVFSNGRWHFEGHDDLRTIHHLASGEFLTSGEAFKAVRE